MAIFNNTFRQLSYSQLGYAALSSAANDLPSAYTMKESISGIPNISNIYWTTSGMGNNSLYKQTFNINPNVDNNFVIRGTGFGRVLEGWATPRVTHVFLSANRVSNPGVDDGIIHGPGFGRAFSNFQAITSIKSSTISGYKLKDSFYSHFNDNNITIHLPGSSLSGWGKTGTVASSGSFVFVVRTVGGWGSSYPNTSALMNIGPGAG